MEKNLKNIECFLFDMDGTLYLENKVIDNAVNVVNKIRDMGKKIVFLSNNSSVSRQYYFDKLTRLGFNPSISEIYTSLNASIDFIKQNRSNKSVYFVGTANAKIEVEQSGITLTQNTPDIVLLTYDKEITYEKLVKLTKFVSQGAEFIASHPDINCPAAEVYQPDIGSFIALVEKSTNKTPTIICGKPSTIIADGISKMHNLTCDKICMVGDRLTTDIAFANAINYTGILVLSGETTLEMAKAFPHKIDFILSSVNEILPLL